MAIHSDRVTEPAGTQSGDFARGIGISHAVSADEFDVAAPLRRADHAMYRAKVAGKNRVAFYDGCEPRRDASHTLIRGPAAASAGPLASS